MVEYEPVIGLFGTCGNSVWRNSFIEEYERLGINSYNPQVDDWTPECAEEEAWHLANDKIINFPILGESYGLGSLSEVGFSILNAIKLDDRRIFIILIENKLSAELNDSELAKESLRARALVKQHLKKLNLSNVYVVDTLEEMLQVSIAMYQAEKIKATMAVYSIANIFKEEQRNFK